MTVLILLLPQKQKHLESFAGLDDGVDITAATETKTSREFCRSDGVDITAATETKTSGESCRS